MSVARVTRLAVQRAGLEVPVRTASEFQSGDLVILTRGGERVATFEVVAICRDATEMNLTVRLHEESS